jgi:thioredoxin 1
MMKNAMLNVSKSFEGKVKVVELDADVEADLTRELCVTSIPCLIFFKDGIEKDRVVGYASEHTIQKWIDKGLEG